MMQAWHVVGGPQWDPSIIRLSGPNETSTSRRLATVCVLLEDAIVLDNECLCMREP